MVLTSTGSRPYVNGASIRDLIRQGVLPTPASPNSRCWAPRIGRCTPTRSRAIEQLRHGRNVVVSSGTGSGKTLAFLALLSSHPSSRIHVPAFKPCCSTR